MLFDLVRWGLSDKMGPVLYGTEESQIPGAGNTTYSEETAREIDVEVRHVLDNCYERAKKILEDNIDVLHSMKDALMEYETIDVEQVDDLMARKPVRPPHDWRDDDFGGRPAPGGPPADDSGEPGVVGGPAEEH